MWFTILCYLTRDSIYLSIAEYFFNRPISYKNLVLIVKLVTVGYFKLLITYAKTILIWNTAAQSKEDSTVFVILFFVLLYDIVVHINVLKTRGYNQFLVKFHYFLFDTLSSCKIFVYNYTEIVINCRIFEIYLK